MLTGNKDVDRKILNNLEDKDLVNVCQTNKKAYSLCNDQVFWMNRVFNKFNYVGGDILRTNKGKDRSWSEYYIQDLQKINKNNAVGYLYSGSERGRLDHVIIALVLGTDIHNGADHSLRFASVKGQLEVVKYLVSQSTDIHGSSNQGLILASKYGHLEIVKYLVELKPDGADVHARNDYALRLASAYDQLKVVKYLVSQGANIHANNDEALEWAIDYGHIEIVKYLGSLE